MTNHLQQLTQLRQNIKELGQPQPPPQENPESIPSSSRHAQGLHGPRAGETQNQQRNREPSPNPKRARLGTIHELRPAYNIDPRSGFIVPKPERLPPPPKAGQGPGFWGEQLQVKHPASQRIYGIATRTRASSLPEVLTAGERRCGMTLYEPEGPKMERRRKVLIWCWLLTGLFLLVVVIVGIYLGMEQPWRECKKVGHRACD